MCSESVLIYSQNFFLPHCSVEHEFRYKSIHVYITSFVAWDLPSTNFRFLDIENKFEFFGLYVETKERINALGTISKYQ